MELNKYIDHTLLKNDATVEDIVRLCDEARKYEFWSVCVSPNYVALAKKQLEDTNVKICSVVGFPSGQHEILVKTEEAKLAISYGADEIDMVINIALIKDKKWKELISEIKTVKEYGVKDKVLKVIIETALLSPIEIERATECVLQAKADFVKTSTGFSTRGASENDIKIMKKIVGDKIGIKAAGGISSGSIAQKMIKAGATRIGTSKGVAIITGKTIKGGY